MIKHILSYIILSAAFITLIGLGTWQMQRLNWKTNIIAQLDEVYNRDPAQYPLSIKDLKTESENAPKILYGSVQGRFIYNKEILVGPVPNEGEIGYRVIAPLKMRDGCYVFVNRGWINQDKREAINTTQPSGLITVTGLLREPDWNRFTPENSPENNIWTKLDLEEIAEAQDINPVSRYLVYAEKSSKDFGILRLQEERWYPRNKHKQYALFWYGMAGVLIIIFGLFGHQKRSRKS